MKLLKKLCIFLVVVLCLLCSLLIVVQAKNPTETEQSNLNKTPQTITTTMPTEQPTLSDNQIIASAPSEPCEQTLPTNMPPLAEENDTTERITINEWTYLPIIDYESEAKTKYDIYLIDNEEMPYVLYVPSTASLNNKLPLVVWLHGSGERGLGLKSYMYYSLPKVIREWGLNFPDAYIACPILRSNSEWATSQSVRQVEAIIDSLLETEYINENRISLTGASLGGIGSLYIGGALNDRLYRIVTFSGYYCGNCIKKITAPIIGFVGHPDTGEDVRSYDYMTKTFYREFGGSTKVMQSSHASLPKDVFSIDENNDGYSDIFMWLIGEQ